MRARSPGGLFWKVFAACWFTSLLTGLGIEHGVDLVRMRHRPTRRAQRHVQVIDGQVIDGATLQREGLA